MTNASTLKLLVFSDLWLDGVYPWAPAGVAEARREAARNALLEIIGVARKEQVDLIACAGDLFNRRTITPANVKWLSVALQKAAVPVLISPGDQDHLGPLGGYTQYQWPDNVTIFDSQELSPVEVSAGVAVWGAAHTEAHRNRSFFDGFRVDRGGVNLALVHAAEEAGAEREPELDLCAVFNEGDIEKAGLDHALVGHYQGAHDGRLHTYSGTPLAHGFGGAPVGTVTVVTVSEAGVLHRARVPIGSPPVHDIEVDLTGRRTDREVLRACVEAVGERRGLLRLRLTGRVPPDVILRREDFTRLIEHDHLFLDWQASVDVESEDLVQEQTVRGQFVRDVLDSARISNEQRQRVLLAGLRALAGSDQLEGPR